MWLVAFRGPRYPDWTLMKEPEPWAFHTKGQIRKFETQAAAENAARRAKKNWPKNEYCVGEIGEKDDTAMATH